MSGIDTTAGSLDTRVKEAWRCGRCGMISETRWYAGTHADRGMDGINERCDGAAEGPYYLLNADDFLDLAAGGGHGR